MIKTKFIVLGCALGCFFEQNAQFFLWIEVSGAY